MRRMLGWRMEGRKWRKREECVGKKRKGEEGGPAPAYGVGDKDGDHHDNEGDGEPEVDHRPYREGEPWGRR